MDTKLTIVSSSTTSLDSELTSPPNLNTFLNTNIQIIGDEAATDSSFASLCLVPVQ